MNKRTLLLVILVVIVLALWLSCREGPPAQDEAMQAGKTTADFPAATEDYFYPMDGGIELTPEQVEGRNTWLVWTGGNEAFWDWLANHSFGGFDLLKTLSSYPCSTEQEAEIADYEAAYAAEWATTPQPGRGYGGASYPAIGYGGADYGGFVCDDAMYPEDGMPPYRYYSRDNRFCYVGLMNEPGFRKPTGPDRWGLCLDERTTSADPFDEAVYGRPSGALGLRLFDNPNFDEAAQRRWDARRFYTDPDYYSDIDLVRPYRVGMSCAFCHVSHHPLHPPEDPENPGFENLSATIGAQYFWFGRVFIANLRPDHFFSQWLDAQLPGAVDTSFVPADNINNPRAMNAIFDLPARLGAADRFHTETSTGGALALPEVDSHRQPADADSSTFPVPHVLWDGADSVGIDAALTRVYINIGEYHQEWIKHINPILGVTPQSPIRVVDAQENSVYWNATQERAQNLKDYLVAASGPMKLAAAGWGPGEAPADGTLHESVAPYFAAAAEEGYEETLTRGKIVFAETCARCHSSKLPADLPGLDEGVECAGANYRECWDRYWAYTETEEFKSRMRELALADDFLDGNYLSSDARIPVDLLETEICSAMAPNAVRGHIWDNFSSESYKSLPDTGDIALPGAPGWTEGTVFSTLDGGRGYQRVPSLVSIWSTAPYLHNNEIGIFTSDPSIRGRMAAFEDGIDKLLWPEKRGQSIHLSDRVTYLKVYPSSMPGLLRLGVADNFLMRGIRSLLGLGWIRQKGSPYVTIGPFPEGMPVNIFANLNFDRQDPEVGFFDFLGSVWAMRGAFNRIYKQGLTGEAAAAEFKQVVPDLLEISSCPDFVANRGHNFAADLGDDDKQALKEFIKTF